jgi:hypothetical protein
LKINGHLINQSICFVDERSPRTDVADSDRTVRDRPRAARLSKWPLHLGAAIEIALVEGWLRVDCGNSAQVGCHGLQL